MQKPSEYERYLGGGAGLEMYRKMSQPQPRLGEERHSYTARQMGLGWKAEFHRSHSQSAQTGTERPGRLWQADDGSLEKIERPEPGIVYAPAAVNLGPMRRVENDLARLYQIHHATAELWLFTHTLTWPLTRRLRSIVYRCDRWADGTSSVVYHARIDVSNSTDAPTFSLTALP